MFDTPRAELVPTSRHTAVAGWFFGPKAENFSYLKERIRKLLEEQHEYRSSLYKDDPPFITESMKGSELYHLQLQRLDHELECIGKWLTKHSVPFFSPRYNAHMSMETSMPSLIGYILGLFQNQNNVALEASPVTSIIEGDVGKQLCRMLGYRAPLNTDAPATSRSESVDNIPDGWGHITCDGSVANLEAIWALRNLKFYPLSLSLAISKGDLKFLEAKFEIELSDGSVKRILDCSSWELLNLKPSTVLDFPQQLYEQYGVSQTALAKALEPYSVQTLGKRTILDEFNVKKEPQFFVTSTRHYSWPKGAAIAGIGRDNMVGVSVDEEARMCQNDIESKLEKAYAEKRAVYCVVAIIGSTEHGAIDPLHDVLDLRDKFTKRGMSFAVHCDAAWGGYFASVLRERQDYSTYTGDPAYVPRMCMSDYTLCQLQSLQKADSITVDPHKSGYCPYPAGGLCYKDGRMRYLVTWTSPVVYRNSDQEDSIGIYGVEGSKPGAAAVGVYVSHNVLGLDKDGYGQLLSEAIFTSKRFYCQWAAMKTRKITVELKNDDKVVKTVSAKLRVTPFNMLPTEISGASNDDVEEQKKFIRRHILKCSNEQIMKNQCALELFKKLGADVTIHTFACNFEVDGNVNEDINEANYLNSRIYQHLSLSSIADNPDTSRIPLFLTSTQMSQDSYGPSLDQFKRRLGLKGDGDLYVLINVTMSPWPSAYNFVQQLAEKFKEHAEEAMKAAVRRNVGFPDLHGFIIQGYQGARICGVHLPMFNMQNHRKQLVISCTLPREVHLMLTEFKGKDENMYFSFGNQEPDILSDLISKGSFKGVVQKGIPGMEGYEQIAENVQISDIKVLFERSLQAEGQTPEYPARMPFRIYSAQRSNEPTPIYNIDHILTRGPNTQLTSEMVQITTEKEADAKFITEEGQWIVLPDVNEREMQPLLPKDDNELRSFNYTKNLPFKPGQTLKFLAFTTQDDALKYDPDTQGTSGRIIKGSVKLGPCFANYGMLNADSGAEGESEVTSESAPCAGNVASLMADHPLASRMPELKEKHQCRKIGTLKQGFMKIKQQQAMAIIPRWASKLAGLGAEK